MKIGDSLRQLSRETQTLRWRAQYRAACYKQPEKVRWICGQPYLRVQAGTGHPLSTYSWLVSIRTGEAK